MANGLGVCFLIVGFVAGAVVEIWWLLFLADWLGWFWAVVGVGILPSVIPSPLVMWWVTDVFPLWFTVVWAIAGGSVVAGMLLRET